MDILHPYNKILFSIPYAGQMVRFILHPWLTAFRLQFTPQRTSFPPPYLQTRSQSPDETHSNRSTYRYYIHCEMTMRFPRSLCFTHNLHCTQLKRSLIYVEIAMILFLTGITGLA